MYIENKKVLKWIFEGTKDYYVEKIKLIGHTVSKRSTPKYHINVLLPNSNKKMHALFRTKRFFKEG